MEKPILDVENLRIRYGGSPTEAVRGISFTLDGSVSALSAKAARASPLSAGLCCASFHRRP